MLGWWKCPNRKARLRGPDPALTVKLEGAYGLCDDNGGDALRTNGKGTGDVRLNEEKRAFSKDDSITVQADMDARPRSLTFFRNLESEPFGTVVGFGEDVLICAACSSNSKCTCKLGLSFVGSQSKSERAETTLDKKQAAMTTLKFTHNHMQDIVDLIT